MRQDTVASRHPPRRHQAARPRRADTGVRKAASATAAVMALVSAVPARAEPYTGIASTDYRLSVAIAWLLLLGVIAPMALAVTVATGLRQPSRPRFWLTATGVAGALALAATLLHIPAIAQELVLMILRLLF